MEKTKYLGVYYDAKTNKYVVQTTFTTKDGFRIKKCKRGFDTAKKAEMWKNETAIQLKKENHTTQTNKKRQLDELLEKYIDYKMTKLKPTTIYIMENRLRTHFVDVFKCKKLEDITPKNIIDYYEYLGSLDIKNQTKNQIIIYVLGFIEWLDLIEALQPSISRKFKLILSKFTITEKPQNDFLELDEFKTFMKTFDDSDKVNRLVFNLLFFSGVRVSELFALQYKDISNNVISITKQAIEKSKCYSKVGNDYDNYYIIPYTKTNTTKYIEIPEWLTDYVLELQQIYQDNDSDYIFIDKTNKALIRNVLIRHLKKANLKHIKIHDFRHSNISLLYDLGADAKYVQERMGHSTPKTSQEIYNHITKKRHQLNDDLIKKLEQI